MPSQMLPTLATNNSAYCALMYLESLCQFELRDSVSVIRSDNLNGLICKLMHAVAFSVRNPKPFLSAAINHIVNPCSKEKVVEIYTRWIVAAMAHFHFWWDFTLKKSPYKPVCGPMLFVMSTLRITPIPKGSLPFMARSNTVSSLDYINVFKKMFSDLVIRCTSSVNTLSVASLSNLIKIIHGGNYTGYSHMCKA